MKLSILAVLTMSLCGASAQHIRHSEGRTPKGTRRAESRSGKGGKGGRSSRSSKGGKKSGSSKGDQPAVFDIKLTPGNEVAPFMGIDFAFGTAVVEIFARKACIETDIEGFSPGSIHIHFAPIDENGSILVSFTDLIHPMEPDTQGCVPISSELSMNIVARPDLYYINAHLGVDLEDPLITRAIRGQFVQGFTADLENSQTVAPFNNNIAGASGVATVAFEEAGTVACFDVTINGFDPLLGHIHNAAAGENGPRVFNYSDLKVAEGRFFGCQDISDDANEGSVDIVKMLLADPSMYYFDYHLSGDQPEIFTSIRGQLPSN